MATKRLIRNHEYYKGIAMESMNRMLGAYPETSRPSIAKALIHCTTSEVLDTMLLDRRLADEIRELIVKELNTRGEGVSNG